MARNLNVAVQPTVSRCPLAKSKMDFRSNEAGRTAPWIEPGKPESFSTRSHSLSR